MGSVGMDSVTLDFVNLIHIDFVNVIIDLVWVPSSLFESWFGEAAGGQS